jgi:predicted Zn-ribbon and HTH transcriptional regulator
VIGSLKIHQEHKEDKGKISGTDQEQVNILKQGKMLTLRKKIAEVLEGECLDLREISKLFKIKEKEALDHLMHIAKSVHPRRLTAEPASCKQCGFSFKKRTRLNTPSRCPVCKSEKIYPPRFKINPS